MRRFTLWALAAAGALLLLVTITPLTQWWARALSHPWLDADGDVLVVLGSEQPVDGTLIGQSSYWRTVYAVRAWRLGHFKTIVVSGGGNIAESMRDYMLCQGIPAEAVVVENRSTSTHENALLTRDLLARLPSAKVVLLTSDYHMYRSRKAFEKAGVRVFPRPFPDILKRGNDWRYRWPVFIELIEESVKIAGYRLRGWI